MSNSPSDRAEEPESGSPVVPRAVVHKQILDSARLNPNASLEELSDVVSGATEDLVDRVLAEYGDPATKPDENKDELLPTEPTASSNTTPVGTQHSTSDGYPPPDQLSEEQRTTLRAIYKHPDATQKELADRFGVCRSAISKRVNCLDGFEWTDRQAYVESVFGDGMTPLENGGSPPDGAEDSCPNSLSDRVRKLEERLDDRSNRPEPLFDDPELLSKILRTCLKSGGFSKDEELWILEQTIRTSLRSRSPS